MIPHFMIALAGFRHLMASLSTIQAARNIALANQRGRSSSPDECPECQMATKLVSWPELGGYARWCDRCGWSDELELKRAQQVREGWRDPLGAMIWEEG